LRTSSKKHLGGVFRQVVVDVGVRILKCSEAERSGLGLGKRGADSGLLELIGRKLPEPFQASWKRGNHPPYRCGRRGFLLRSKLSNTNKQSSRNRGKNKPMRPERQNLGQGE